MGWFKRLIQFWKENLEHNYKRMSIGVGSFLILIVTTCILPVPQFLAALYGGGVTLASIIVMSIFGKNGNGDIVRKDSEDSIPE